MKVREARGNSNCRCATSEAWRKSRYRSKFFFVKHTRVSGKRPTTAATKRALYTNPTLHQAQGVISSGFCV